MPAENSHQRRLFPALILLLVAIPLSAQLSAPPAAEAGFTQRLSWIADEFVQRYEIVIEKEDDDEGYRQVLRMYTIVPFVEVSLQPGRYRFQIIPYDFLDRRGEASPWMNFEIRAALTPGLDSFSPDFLYLLDNVIHEIAVYGSDLVEGARIFLRCYHGMIIYPIEAQISQDGSHARLLFFSTLLTAGEYEVVVINPGGMEARMAGIAFIYPEPEPKPDYEAEEYHEEAREARAVSAPQDLYLSLGWMPMFPFDNERQLFEADRAFAGEGVRFGFFFPRRDFIVPGLEFFASWHLFDAEQSVTFGFGFLAREWLPSERAALNFRIGAAVSISSENRNIPRMFDNEYSLNINIGLSYLWLFRRHFYFEAGLDYINIVREDRTGWLRPWIGFGWRHFGITRNEEPGHEESRHDELQHEESQRLSGEYHEPDSGIASRSPPYAHMVFAWMPKSPVLSDSMLFDRDLLFHGLGLRLGFVSSRHRIANPGMEFAMSWVFLDTLQYMTTGLNFLIQRWLLDERMALNLRLGAGVSLFLDSGDVAENLFEIIHFNTNMGFSFLWMLRGNIYLEAGLDFVGPRTGDQQSWFRPWAGIGWRYQEPFSPRSDIPGAVADAGYEPPNMYLGFAFIPPLFALYHNLRFSGAGFSLGVVSAQESFINLGFEIAASWLSCETLQSFTMDFNFLGQRWLVDERMALNLRFGAGVSLFPVSGYIPEIIGSAYVFNVNAGLSFLWMLGHSFYVETGVDVIHFIRVHSSALSRPWMGVGWRF